MGVGDWGDDGWDDSPSAAAGSDEVAVAQHAKWMDDGIEADGPEVDDIDLGEDPPVDEMTGELLDEPVTPRATGSDRPQRVLGVDVGSLATQAIDEAVQAAVQRQVTKMAQKSVAAAMTPQLIAALQARAQEATAAAVEEHVGQDEPNGSAETGEPTTLYGSLDEWVREHLRKSYCPRIDGKNRIWSAQWWRYPEALIRLDAIWRAWESLRLDAATGLSIWWRDHADYHLNVLMNPATSPFPAVYEDAANTSERGEWLPYEAPPKELFPDVRKQPPGTQRPAVASRAAARPGHSPHGEGSRSIRQPMEPTSSALVIE